jgi:outer membrane protein TolC
MLPTLPVSVADFPARFSTAGSFPVAWALCLLLVSAVGAQPVTSGQGIGAGPSAPGAQAPVLQRPSVLGSVPDTTVGAGTVGLTLRDAIDRALRANLAILLGEQGVESARAARWRALGGLLPSAHGSLSAAREQINLEAFGFSIPGQSPLIGPFSVYDARLFVSLPVFDLAAIDRARAGVRNLEAAGHGMRDARDLVVQATVASYMQAVAARSRVDAVASQLDTARALAAQARDQREAGLAAGIDVLRAQVQADAVEQRLIVARNDFARARLTLARVVGIPVEHDVDLVDPLGFGPLDTMTPEAALAVAFDNRPDLKGARARLAAAEAERRAAGEEHLPAVFVGGEYGVIGQTASGALPTFAAVAGVRVPILDRGQMHAREIEAEANLVRLRASVADLGEQIAFEVRMALADVTAADDRVRVAQGSVDLATRQLQQARDRFSAGVANTIELVQAQEALANAQEQYISSLFAQATSRAALARSLGDAEHGIVRFLGVTP